MNLTDDAMLVDLRITAWSGRRYDREASDHVAASHDAASSAGRYNKHLLPKSAFAALTAVTSEARKTHYAQTLPWDDKGARLLTVANYDRYTELLDAIRERMVRQRTRFIEDYDLNVDQARLNLGKLFHIEDYPSKEALIGKFSVRTTLAIGAIWMCSQPNPVYSDALFPLNSTFNKRFPKKLRTPPRAR